jgi:hypothetical protein
MSLIPYVPDNLQVILYVTHLPELLRGIDNSQAP